MEYRDVYCSDYALILPQVETLLRSGSSISSVSVAFACPVYIVAFLACKMEPGNIDFIRQLETAEVFYKVKTKECKL